MLIQEFLFLIEYLPGPENVVADAMAKTTPEGTPSEVNVEVLEFIKLMCTSIQLYIGFLY